MPDISLLEPTVLNTVVQKLTAPEDLVLLNKVPRHSHPFPEVTWDIIKGSRMVAKPNVANSEAHVVAHLGRSQGHASFVYLREKKVFSPTTLYWLRAPGSLLATQRAEEAVQREINDLSQRFDNFAEISLWGSLSGNLVLDYPDVQANVDYGFASSHKPTPGVLWTAAGKGAKDIVDDVRTWKRLIRQDGRVNAQDAFATEVTMSLVVNKFIDAGVQVNTTGSYAAGNLLSDRMKDEYFADGTITGFMGLNWTQTESVYDDDNGTRTLFFGDNKVLIGNFTEGTPIELYEGPTADFDFAQPTTGKSAKTWQEEDPSARQYLLEWNMMPVITRPEQFVSATVG